MLSEAWRLIFGVTRCSILQAIIVCPDTVERASSVIGHFTPGISIIVAENSLLPNFTVFSRLPRWDIIFPSQKELATGPSSPWLCCCLKQAAMVVLPQRSPCIPSSNTDLIRGHHLPKQLKDSSSLISSRQADCYRPDILMAAISFSLNISVSALIVTRCIVSKIVNEKVAETNMELNIRIHGF